MRIHPADRPPSATAPATPAAEVSPEPTPTEEAPQYNDPTPSDFGLAFKIKRQQCFGSAGCNVDVEPDLTYKGILPLDPDKTYDITYKLNGDESGPVINTIELTNGTSLEYTPRVGVHGRFEGQDHRQGDGRGGDRVSETPKLTPNSDGTVSVVFTREQVAELLGDTAEAGLPSTSDTTDGVLLGLFDCYRSTREYHAQYRAPGNIGWQAVGTWRDPKLAP